MESGSFSQAERNPWIVRVRPKTNPRSRLFCFSFAGGGPSFFRDWTHVLPADVELLAVHLPGRESRIGETPFQEIEPLMQALVPALLPYIDREYFLFGHSLGALVAFEFARRVEARNARRPAQLLVSGRIAPHVRARMGLHKMSDAELLGTIERLSATPRQILEDPEMRAHYLPLLRADLTINETYECRGEVPLRCPISVWAGVDDPMTSLKSLRAWGAQTEFPLRLRMLSGNHFSYLRTAEFRTDLASILKTVSVGDSIESAVREV